MDISDLDTANEMWVQLQQKFRANSVARKFELLSRLYSFGILPGEKIEEMINRFKLLVMELKSVKEEISDHQFQYALMKGLPEEFKVFRTALDAQAQGPTLPWKLRELYDRIVDY